MGPKFNTATLTDAVNERLIDVPSHTMVEMHTIVKAVVEVLIEWGFMAKDDKQEEE